MAYNTSVLKPFLELPEPYRCPTCPYCNGERTAEIRFPNKLAGYSLWKAIGEPKFAVAPMVDQSELPFRMMCRKYGAQLAYTPMFHSRLFSQDPEYRRTKFTTCEGDRPLFVQFCGNQADVVLAAAKQVEEACDAVDINLGCPQGIARRGNYGSFLMEQWDVIHTIIHTLHVELKIPVTAKMRIFGDVPTTLRYARMLRDAGAQVIGVHGRTREMKGQDTGVADWEHIAGVKQHITSIPIIANGNVEKYSDAIACLKATGCDGVMSAEGLLWDPRLFSNPESPVLTGRRFQVDKATRLAAIATAAEFVEHFAARYETEMASTKAHVWKLVHHTLEVHLEFRDVLSKVDHHTAELQRFLEVFAQMTVAEQEYPLDGPYEKREKKPTSPSGAEEEEDGGDPFDSFEDLF